MLVTMAHRLEVARAERLIQPVRLIARIVGRLRPMSCMAAAHLDICLKGEFWSSSQYVNSK